MAISLNYMGKEQGGRQVYHYGDAYKTHVVTAFVFMYYLMGFFADKSLLLIFFLVAIPVIFAFFGIAYIESSKRSVADKMLSLQPPKIPLFQRGWEVTTDYYPSLKIGVSPIFSIKAFLNECVLTCLVIFGGWALITLGSLREVAIMGCFAVGLAWANFAAVNLYFAYRIKRARFTHSKTYINMKYSGSELNRICEKAWSNLENDCSEEAVEKLFDDLMLMAHHATAMAHITNDLIKDDAVEAKTISSEIVIIETIINSFIVEVCETTNRFFERNSDHRDIAIDVYLKSLFPELSAEIQRTDEKLMMVLETIGAIHNNRRANIAKTINADAELNTLIERSILPVPAFPEFHELNFPSIEKRVAAQNIVIGSLAELVTAKEAAVSTEAKEKLELQIEKVKEFVRSLAVGTPESVMRAERLKKTDSEDVLYITNERDDINNIDNHIAITQKYIDSYDRSLAYNDDKNC